MTTQYVFQPVLIETEEQASAFPAGTLAYAEFESDLIPQEQVGFGWSNIFIKYGDEWQNTNEPDASYSDKWVLGFTALVRVKVEIEESISVPHHTPPQFREISFLEDTNVITDDNGRDITVEYTEWMSSLPRKTRFASRWD